MAKIDTVEDYFDVHPKWKNELMALRNLIKTYPFNEGLKWSRPVYDIEGKNILGIGAFKDHYGIWFFNGGLHEKHTQLLQNAQEGKTHAMRQIKGDKQAGPDMEELSKYIEESIEIHKLGKKLTPKVLKEMKIPEELKDSLLSNNDLETAFNNLTPGKKREYCDFINEAKRKETKIAR
ncbi:MAG TPA: DUF1801 domain-containing protein, partial [Gillisia sp.]|nr:DUF1801 domain-containing protein [Gillisia sp.]